MEAWIIFTVAAAFLQNLRNGMQKSLNSVLSISGAAYTRFAFGLPLAFIYWIFLISFSNEQLNWGWAFWIYSFVGGLAQVLAMVSILLSFSLRGFTVGTAYAKIETLMTAFFTIMLLGEEISSQVFFAIIISLAGVFILSNSKSGKRLQDILFSWTDRSALYGLASACLLGLSAVSYRGAALSMDANGVLLPAASTLLVALAIQTTMMTAYLILREKGEISMVWRNRGKGLVVGLASMLGSVGWFTAMTLQNAAYVRALGQVELIFTFLTSVLIFRERITKTEIAGTLLIVGGVLILIVE